MRLRRRVDPFPPDPHHQLRQARALEGALFHRWLDGESSRQAYIDARDAADLLHRQIVGEGVESGFRRPPGRRR